MEPPAKLSPTEILKRKLLQQEEERTGIRMTIRGSYVFSNTNPDAITTSRFRKECRSYEALPYAPSDVNQLEWWCHHQEQFPILSHLVRITFAVPVASSKSERVFSVAGMIVTNLRACLNPEKVENIVIVKTNKPFLRELRFKN